LSEEQRTCGTSAATPVQYHGDSLYCETISPIMMSFMMNGKVCTREVMSAVRKRKRHHQHTHKTGRGGEDDIHMNTADHRWNTCSFSCEVPVRRATKLIFVANALREEA
jgi:hypothetical protein